MEYLAGLIASFAFLCVCVVFIIFIIKFSKKLFSLIDNSNKLISQTNNSLKKIDVLVDASAKTVSDIDLTVERVNNQLDRVDITTKKIQNITEKASNAVATVGETVQKPFEVILALINDLMLKLGILTHESNVTDTTLSNSDINAAKLKRQADIRKGVGAVISVSSYLFRRSKKRKFKTRHKV